MSKEMITTWVTCLALIGGSIAWAVTNFAGKDDTLRLEQIAQQHVPVSSYEQHLENEESQYVLALKKEIREVSRLLESEPEDEYLQEALADLLDTLCELRSNDRLCQ